MWLKDALERLPGSTWPFKDEFADFLGVDPGGLPILAEDFDGAEHPNLQLALEALAGSSTPWRGVAGQNKRFSGLTLSDLIASRGDQWAPKPGPVEYINRPIGEGTALACIQFGYALIESPAGKAVLFVRGPTEHSHPPQGQIEVMALEQSTAVDIMARLRSLMHAHNVYRGKVVTFGSNQYGAFTLHFASLPVVGRDQVIVPTDTLRAMERHTIEMTHLADRLRASGRHLKRGLLLYGSPGTGKTHSLAYLVGQMPERSVILLSGLGLGVLSRAFALARTLQPALVVLEDVDLVAMSRDLPGMDVNPLLFELLNQMDGLAEDVDLIVALTTNRVDLLEPALAARPGRIDQALEIPLPVPHLRRKLIELYGRGLDLQIEDWDSHLRRTEGASPALIKELLRRAAVIAAESDSATITDQVLRQALDEVLSSGSRLAGLLGGSAVPT